MNKEINYTDAPPEVEESLSRAVRIPNHTFDKTVTINTSDMAARLQSWLAKVEPVYQNEVKASMDAFKREIGLNA